MTKPVCPVCSGTDCEPAPDEDGAMVCLNRNCRVKYLWPQPPPPAQAPEVAAAKAVADLVPPELTKALMDELAARQVNGA